MGTILQREIQLGLKDNQTHIQIPFELVESYQALEIQFFYTPQIVEEEQARQAILRALPLFFPSTTGIVPDDFLPLVNLVTISLDYDERYIGGYHNKNANQLIRISPVESNQGFFSCEILPGRWVIQLHAHCIQSERVDVTLIIRGER